MFMHFYRYKTRYSSQHPVSDERLEIVYPTDEHAMITVGHDFYVIGRFHGIEVSPTATLIVELIRMDTEKVIRTVFTEKKDYKAGIYAEYAGIETEEDVETVRSCGMPDLVYDPADPDSFWNTWNKAYYTDQVFSALVYGGTCLKEETNPYDQFGEKLCPIQEGYYELRVTLKNGEEKLVSSKTLWFTEGQKEIILSRFSPEHHLQCVEQFAKKNGFEAYTDPYAGIWDTQYFSIEWPVKAWVEIPGRWHFGDAQEYESGVVHFFDYNISDACVSWRTEIGTMLAKEEKCVDDPERLRTYFYKNGHPDLEDAERNLEQLELMPSGNYVRITQKKICREGIEKWLHTEAICKPIPAKTKKVSGCVYEIQNTISTLEYALFYEGETESFFNSGPYPTGVIRKKEEAPDETLLLHASHNIKIEMKKEAENIRMLVRARDKFQTVLEEAWYDVPVL